MHGINSGCTGYFNRKYDRVGHLFQGRGGRNNTPEEGGNIFDQKGYGHRPGQKIKQKAEGESFLM